MLFLTHQEEKETIAKKKAQTPLLLLVFNRKFISKTDKLDGILAKIHIFSLIENHLLFTAIIYFSFDKNTGYRWQAYCRISQQSSHNSKN